MASLRLISAALLMGVFAPASIGQDRVDDAPREAAFREEGLRGEIAAVAADSVTVLQRGDDRDRTRTVKIDGRTQILFPSDEKVRVVAEDGNVVERPRVRVGKIGDLKPGQRVVLAVGPNAAAIRIVVQTAPAVLPMPRKGDAPRDGDAPRERPARPQARRQVHSGWVTRREGNQVVLKLRGEGREFEREVALPERTRVSVQTKEMEEVMGDGGRRITRQKVRIGALADIAVGKYVVVRQFGAESAQVTVLLGDGREAPGRDLPAGKEFAGKLTQIDANAIVVEGNGPDGKKIEVFALDDNTQVLLGERRGQLTDLQPGQEVVVMWSEANKAARVTVRGK